MKNDPLRVFWWSLHIATLTLAVSLTANVYASNEIPGPPQKQPIALVGGIIHTISGETIDGGTLIVSPQIGRAHV